MKTKYLAVALAAAFAMTLPAITSADASIALNSSRSNVYRAQPKSAIDNWQGHNERTTTVKGSKSNISYRGGKSNSQERFVKGTKSNGQERAIKSGKSNSQERGVHGGKSNSSERERTISRFPHPSHGGNQIFDRWGNI